MLLRLYTLVLQKQLWHTENEAFEPCQIQSDNMARKDKLSQGKTWMLTCLSLFVSHVFMRNKKERLLMTRVTMA